MADKGYIHLYTGNGQGKTTAAFGVALRALATGRRVFIGQFVKSIKYSETDIENCYLDATIVQYGRRCFIDGEPDADDKTAAESGWEQCCRVLTSGDYDLVILDELTIALYYGLLDIKDVVDGILARDASTEMIITGRYAPQELLDMADLVTDMREVKHYYTQGVLSRKGFDN